MENALIPDEMIVAEHFFIRFLRRASDGVIEVVDRHHADQVQIVRRNLNGTDGEKTTVVVR